MFPKTLAFMVLFLGTFVHAADHAERQSTNHGAFPACERKLWNARWLNNPLTGEPQKANDEDGFVSDQMPLTVETMEQAYSVGVYLGGESEDGNALLYTPTLRGVMLLDPNDPDANIPKRDLRKMRVMRAAGYQVKVDHDFGALITGCQMQARARDPKREWRKPSADLKQSQSWITDGIKELYKKMHLRPQRLAHCIGTYYENKLVAGLYVTVVRGVITGESMFYLPGVGDDAAKLALWELRNRARIKGHKFIDTEDSLGLIMDWGHPDQNRRKIPRSEYQDLLREQQALDRSF